MEVVQTTLHDQKLSKFLWGEATKTVVYVQNRIPHQALDNKTPEEVFTGVKPNIGHLRYLVVPCIFMCQGQEEQVGSHRNERFVLWIL